MKRTLLLVFPLFSLTGLAQSPSGKIMIKKGQHFVIESKTDGNVTEEMMGQSMAMTIGSTTKINADIKDVKQNIYTITQTLTNVKSTFSGMGQEKSFDSDKKEDIDSETVAIYKDRLNVPKDVLVTNEGKPVTTADTSNKPADANPMTAMMDMMGGGQENIATTLFLVIPPGKKVGDTWQDSTVSDGIKLKRTYILKSISNKEASVTVNGLLDINKKMQVQGMDMTTAMTSKINSAVVIDVVSGIQKQNNTSTDVTGTIDMMGQSVPVTSKITTVTTVTPQ